ARHAQPAVAERLDDLRKPLHELRGSLPVMCGALGEPELPVEEVEEAGISELRPAPAPVEVRESNEEIGHDAVLAAEEIDEPPCENACVCHPARFPCRSHTDYQATARY